MSGSVNKVILIGNLGKDPEVRTMQSGDKVCNLTIATSERWKDKSGERQEKTEWHRIVIFSQPIIGVAENYLKKGAKVFIEGQLETRKWSDSDGTDKYTTEIVLRPFKGELTMLESRDAKNDTDATEHTENKGWGSYQPETKPLRTARSSKIDELEDEIPF